MYQELLNFIFFAVLAGSSIAYGFLKFKSWDSDVAYYVGLFTSILKNLVDLIYGLPKSLKATVSLIGYCCSLCFPPKKVAPEDNADNVDDHPELSMDDSIAANASSEHPARVSVSSNDE